MWKVLAIPFHELSTLYTKVYIVKSKGVYMNSCFSSCRVERLESDLCLKVYKFLKVDNCPKVYKCKVDKYKGKTMSER